MPLIIHVNGAALVVLDADNVRRIEDRDPLIIDLAEVARQVGAPIAKLVVTVGDDADVEEIMRLAREQRPGDALRYACRGWKSRPNDFHGMVRINTTTKAGHDA